MPKVCWDFVSYRDGDTDFSDSLRLDFSVDSEGVFYCYPRSDVYDLIEADKQLRSEFGLMINLNRKREGVVGAATLEELKGGLERALSIVCTPKVSEELVIVYNVESHVSFAELPDGTIVPNASWPGAEWPILDEEMYGGHHATDPAYGGYSLVVGARAYRKRTKDFGSSKHTYYEWYYGRDEKGEYLDHRERQHPAGLLNSWVSFDLYGGKWGRPEHSTKEMPYTDEAALFFHRLMLGMAELQRKIQTMIADQKTFIDFVNAGGRFLGGPDA